MSKGQRLPMEAFTSLLSDDAQRGERPFPLASKASVGSDKRFHNESDRERKQDGPGFNPPSAVGYQAPVGTGRPFLRSLAGRSRPRR
jgi:hypothetical protein